MAAETTRGGAGSAAGTRASTSNEPRRPSYVIAGSMSWRGTAGDRALKTLSSNSLSGVGPLTFERVVNTQVGMHYFLKFCADDDMSSASLLFWFEARAYMQLAGGIHRELAARKIFNKFFAPDAPLELAVPADITADMSRAMSSHTGPGTQVFEDAVAEVTYTLRYDVFPRFLTSRQYFKLVNITLEERMRIDIVRTAASLARAPPRPPRTRRGGRRRCSRLPADHLRAGAL